MTDTSEEHQGGCLCGAVRYTLRSAPDWSAHCHCRSCQKATGAGFATWVGVKEENFEVSHGRLAICVSSPGVQRGFCDQCGSSLTYVGDRWPGQVSVLAATLDEPGIATPTAHVYVEHKLPWVRLDDDLTKYKRFPGD
ncbi:MAG: GFA family protein [Proteobacteria bacterium]|nr:GFA family protein [Pseudomonadota bacterium]